MNKAFILLGLITSIAYGQTNSNIICEDQNCMTLEQNICWLKNHIINISKLDNNDERLKKCLTYNHKGGSSCLRDENIPWGAYYFPYKKGGITQRWKKLTPQYFYSAVEKDLNWDRYKKMSSQELSKLSPAEKLDIYFGLDTFPITRWEIQNRGLTRKDPDGGFCNGARTAGVLIKKEPIHPIKVKPKGFQEFEIYPTDLKALASASYFHPQYTVRFGDRTCFVESDIFDIALRYFIEERNTAVCIDVDSSRTGINNKTILGFDRRIDSALTTRINANETLIRIHLTIYCLGEYSENNSNKETRSIIADFRNHLNEKWVTPLTYDYNLKVDNDNRIIGGTWLFLEGNNARPDFIWIPFGNGDDDNAKYKDDKGNPHLKYEYIKTLLELQN